MWPYQKSVSSLQNADELNLRSVKLEQHEGGSYGAGKSDARHELLAKTHRGINTADLPGNSSNEAKLSCLDTLLCACRVALRSHQTSYTCALCRAPLISAQRLSACTCSGVRNAVRQHALRRRSAHRLLAQHCRRCTHAFCAQRFERSRVTTAVFSMART